MVRVFASAFSAAATTSSSEPPLSARAPAHLEGEDHAGDAAASPRLFRRRRGHVVLDQHRAHFDVFEGGHLGSHVEVQHVAAVVAVDVDHTRAARDALGDGSHLVGAGRGEDVAHRAAVQHALADVAEKDGEMARAAAGGQRHLALDRRVGPHDAVQVFLVGKLSGWALIKPSNISGTNPPLCSESFSWYGSQSDYVLWLVIARGRCPRSNLGFRTDFARRRPPSAMTSLR